MLLQVICAYANVDAVLIESVTNPDWLAAMLKSQQFWTMPGNERNLYFKCK
jgi:hypothetical protein